MLKTKKAVSICKGALSLYKKLLFFSLLLLFVFLGPGACAKFPDIEICNLKDTGERRFVGKGTPGDPYILCTYEDLIDKLQDPNNLSAHFAMYANIDARETWSQGSASACIAYDGTNAATATCEGWEPVGNFTTPFTGDFDGRGHGISDLWIKRDILRMGFFGSMGNASSEPNIRDLSLLDVGIQGGGGTNNIGGLLGVQTAGTITNSYITGDVNGGTGSDKAGALVGEQNGDITNSYATGEVNGGDNDDNVGGLVGEQAGGMITNSHATGEVNGGINNDNVGGLVGEQAGGMITSSHATGEVNGGINDDNVGGLLGSQSGDITNSYATGKANGDTDNDKVGGLVGEQDGDITNSHATGEVNGGGGPLLANSAGGLVGYQTGGMITNSYATGDVNGGITVDKVGGLVGEQDGDITSSYATGDTNGGDGLDSAGGLVGYQQNNGTTTNSYATGDANGGADDDRVGALVGLQLSGTITESYALGDANGGADDDRVGALVGQQDLTGTITNSYAVGSVDGGTGTNNVGGFVGELSGTISGTNYYFNNVPVGMNGIGTGTCGPMACIQETDPNFTTIFGALFGAMQMNWDNTIWSGSGRDGHPCLVGFNFGGPGDGCP